MAKMDEIFWKQMIKKEQMTLVGHIVSHPTEAGVRLGPLGPVTVYAPVSASTLPSIAAQSLPSRSPHSVLSEEAALQQLQRYGSARASAGGGGWSRPLTGASASTLGPSSQRGHYPEPSSDHLSGRRPAPHQSATAGSAGGVPQVLKISRPQTASSSYPDTPAYSDDEESGEEEKEEQAGAQSEMRRRLSVMERTLAAERRARQRVEARLQYQQKRLNKTSPGTWGVASPTQPSGRWH